MKAWVTFAFMAALQQDYHNGLRRARGLSILPHQDGGKQAEMAPFQERICMPLFPRRDYMLV